MYTLYIFLPENNRGQCSTAQRNAVYVHCSISLSLSLSLSHHCCRIGSFYRTRDFLYVLQVGTRLSTDYNEVLSHICFFFFKRLLNAISHEYYRIVLTTTHTTHNINYWNATRHSGRSSITPFRNKSYTTCRIKYLCRCRWWSIGSSDFQRTRWWTDRSSPTRLPQ